MDKRIEYIITKEDAGVSIDTFLRRRGITRHIITGMKRTQDGIVCNGECAYTSVILRVGDHLALHIEDEESRDKILPVELPFSVVYEDEDILVVDKPKDMPVHPSIGNYENTLANALAFYYRNEEHFVFRAINRLDRDTTGLLIIAKNPLSGAILSIAMKKREIHRTYLAVVSGKPSQARGVIDAPIARKEGSAIERCVDEKHGDRAVTHYEVLASGEEYSLILLRLESGRTHQIRVHMKYIGHPLPGDFLYNPDFSAINRQPLHSAMLSFKHPITGEKMTFTCPLPEDMRKQIDFKRQNI